MVRTQSGVFNRIVNCCVAIVLIAVRRLKGVYSSRYKRCVMALAFPGNYGKLRNTVARTGLPGKWRELNYGQKQFRTDDGGYLNWWQTTKTVTFQGHNLAAREELAEAFIAVASAKKRLLGQYRGREFHGRLRSLYAD
jgi:hypothetical protein